MNIVEREVQLSEVGETPMLWVVMIDLNCGYRSPDWQQNSEPKALASALLESAELRRDEWICRLAPALD